MFANFMLSPGVTLWTPSELPGLALWIDVGDTSTISLNGSDISQINDKSGLGRHFSQPIASLQPNLLTAYMNGLPCMDMPNHTMSCSIGGILGATNNIGYWASFVMMRSTATTGTQSLMFISRGGSTSQARNAIRMAGRRLNVDGRRLDSNGAASFTSGRVYTSNEGGFIGAEWEYSGSTVRSWVDGSLVSTNVLHTPGVTSPTNSASVRIGGTGAEGERFAGKIAEIICVSSPLSVENINRINGYLAHKWGRTFLLPAGHPYQLAAPTL